MEIFNQLLYMFIATALLATLTYLASSIVTEKAPSKSNWLLTCLIHYVVLFFNYYVLGRESPYMLFVSLCMMILISYANHRAWSGALIRDGFIIACVYIIGDMLTGMLSMAIWDLALIEEARYFHIPLSILINCLTGAALLALSALYGLFRSIIRKHSLSFYLLRILRPAFLLTTCMILYARNMNRISALSRVVSAQEILFEYAIIAIILFLGATYVVQDIRYAQQVKRNETLEYQQKVQNSLLQETRMFRHNIANMLYGLQGLFFTKNYGRILSYYREIVEKCAVINNENVIALRRIPSMAVSALLMQKIQTANDLSIPFYVFTDERLNWRNLKDETITQILGVLIDNAQEATLGVDARYLSVEIHNVSKGIEFAVRNTWKQDNEDLLYTNQEKTSKAGHTGIGLNSVRKLIEKDRRMIFNIYPTGRYIEASILVFW